MQPNPPSDNCFLAAALLGLGAAGVFEARVVFRQHDETQALRRRAAAEQRRITALRIERDTAQQDLLAAEQELAALAAPPVVDAATAGRQGEIKAWLARLKRLQQLFAERADQRIPELALLADEDWLRAAFDDEHDIRQAFADLRTRAKGKFYSCVGEALRNYIKTAGREAPPSILTLAAYFEQPIDPAILQRYEIFKGSLPSNPASQVEIVRRFERDRAK